MEFFLKTSDQAMHDLKTSLAGLSTAEAKARLEETGLNRLPEEPITPWYRVLFAQINSPLVYVLLVAALVSWLLGERVDTFVILVAVFIQVIVGLIQEYKAQAALTALKQVISLSAQVLRNGGAQTIPAEQLVPGDIITVQAGDKVPADGRVLTGQDLQVNEAPLTGESEPVQKNTKALTLATTSIGDQTNMIFTGTVVTKGQAQAVVTTTGSDTALGQIAALLKSTAEAPTPLQVQLSKFAQRVTIVVLIIAIAIFAFGYLTGGNVVAMFTMVVAVSVSAIPEGLAVAVTIILAMGMQRILRRKALVRKLVAAETLGSVDVICTDKTGTLTAGKMQVTDIVTWDKQVMFALRLGLLCNDAQVTNPDDDIADWVISGNLTERALFLAASQAGLHYTAEHKAAPRIDVLPFDSAVKYMATLHREPQGRMLYVKGAPDILTDKCSHVLVNGKGISFDAAKRAQFEHKFTALSKRGLRIIALAYKPVAATTRTVAEAGISDLTFVGYVGIKDPLRPEAKPTIAQCRQAGIHTVIITGDHKLTAQTIAKELGINGDPEHIIEGSELDALSQHELNKRVQHITVYARVTPQHKLRIVKAWQANGKVVAMTGDGINDSPAIKAADIGVALGSGTDVAKETADMVILDDNFGSIVAAVEEGRGIFDNIRKTVLYLISDSFSEVIIIIGALVLGMPAPLLATQILWVNLVNDSFPSLAMTQEPKEPQNMHEPPRGRHSSILDAEVNVLIIAVSLLSGVLNLGLYYYVYTTTGDVRLARTATFFSIGIDSLLLMFSIRSLRQMIYQKNPFTNYWLVLALVFGATFMVLPVYTPLLQNYMHTTALPLSIIGLVVAISIFEVIILEIFKFIFIRVRLQRLPAVGG